MANKIVFRFASGDRGWTETFYTTGGNVLINGTRNQHSQFIEARLQCSPAVVGLVSVTAYDTENPRVSKTTVLNEPGTWPITEAEEVNMYYPEVAARFGMSSEGGQRRKYWLRGLPSTGIKSVVNNLGVAEVQPRNMLRSKLNAVADAIKNGAYRLQHLAPAVGPNMWIRLLRLEIGEDGFIALRYPMGNIDRFLDVEYVYCRGLDWCRWGGLRGRLPVLSTGNGIITVKQAYQLGQLIVDQPVGQNAAVRPHVYDYSDIEHCGFEVISDHDTGKKPGLPVGRSSGNRCRLSIPAVE